MRLTSQSYLNILWAVLAVTGLICLAIPNVNKALGRHENRKIYIQRINIGEPEIGIDGPKADTATFIDPFNDKGSKNSRVHPQKPVPHSSQEE